MTNEQTEAGQIHAAKLPTLLPPDDLPRPVHDALAQLDLAIQTIHQEAAFAA